MTARRNPKFAHATDLLIIGSLPIVCLAAIVCLALFSATRHETTTPQPRTYNMQRFGADTRQVFALLHYLAEPEPSYAAPEFKSSPLLIHSNYARAAFTNKVDPI